MDSLNFQILSMKKTIGLKMTTAPLGQPKSLGDLGVGSQGGEGLPLHDAIHIHPPPVFPDEGAGLDVEGAASVGLEAGMEGHDA